MAGQGARQREYQNEMIAAMARFEWDMHHAIGREGRLPDAWREIWEKKGAPKERLTFRVDRDVVRFFKSMGDGYGPRMNSVLRSFMLARLAGLIRHGDLTESYREKWMETPRPTAAAQAVEAERVLADAAEAQAILALQAQRGGTLPPEKSARLKILAARYG